MSGWSGLVGREDARRVLGAVLREEDAEHGRVVAGDDREVLVVERLAHHHGDGLAGLELELANLAVLAPEEEPLVGAEDLRRAELVELEILEPEPVDRLLEHLVDLAVLDDRNDAVAVAGGPLEVALAGDDEGVPGQRVRTVDHDHRGTSVGPTAQVDGTAGDTEVRDLPQPEHVVVDVRLAQGEGRLAALAARAGQEEVERGVVLGRHLCLELRAQRRIVHFADDERCTELPRNGEDLNVGHVVALGEVRQLASDAVPEGRLLHEEGRGHVVVLVRTVDDGEHGGNAKTGIRHGTYLDT